RIVYLSPHTFFFQLSLHHRDLHSFPTRRSSDLAVRHVLDSRTDLLVDGRRLAPQPRPKVTTAEQSAGLQPESGRVVAILQLDARSEEHTSELQSRGHLVCRLLLEKKKKKIQTRT